VSDVDVGRMNARMGTGLTSAISVETQGIRREIAEEDPLPPLLNDSGNQEEFILIEEDHTPLVQIEEVIIAGKRSLTLIEEGTTEGLTLHQIPMKTEEEEETLIEENTEEETPLTLEIEEETTERERMIQEREMRDQEKESILMREFERENIPMKEQREKKDLERGLMTR
jgi:hypothetical protein